MYNHLEGVCGNGNQRMPRRVKKESPAMVEDQCMEEGRYSVINMINDEINGMPVSEDVG